jgi:hypothetical protein
VTEWGLGGGLDEARVDEQAGGWLVAARESVDTEVGFAAEGQFDATCGGGAEQRECSV